MQFFTTELTSQKCNMLQGQKKKTGNRLQVQYYLQTAEFDMLYYFIYY